jgi:hypothetical protein
MGVKAPRAFLLQRHQPLTRASGDVRISVVGPSHPSDRWWPMRGSDPGHAAWSSRRNSIYDIREEAISAPGPGERKVKVRE